MSADELALLACGDVGPIHEPISAYPELVRSVLAEADIRFAQVERIYSSVGTLQTQAGNGHSRCDPTYASVLTDCGFDVVSVASNHAMDWGWEALEDSMRLLQSKGIQTVGCGRNLQEARRPAIVERKDISIAFLAYCSVLREGYAAGAKRPGVAPLRARTYYEPVDYQAGVPPRIVTQPNEKDLENMAADVASAKKQWDVVVVSLHWGVHYVPRIIADYQPTAAKVAFDSGADLILGHHAHVPKAIGVIDGKVCYYSLSNFIMSTFEKKPQKAAQFARTYNVTMDDEYPRLPYGADAKRSLIAKVSLTKTGVKRAAFLPVLIDKQLRPEVLKRGDSRFDDAVRYMEWASEGHNHRFSIEGDEVVVASA
jgi:poly-gamma-glutamate synthesis protein (capsule biosynthesis protein)